MSNNILCKEDFGIIQGTFNSEIKKLNKEGEVFKYFQFNKNKDIYRNEISEIIRKAEDNYNLKKKDNIINFTQKWKKYLVIAFVSTLLFQFLFVGFLIIGVMNKTFGLNEVYKLFFIILGENFVQILILTYIILRLFDVGEYTKK